MHLPPATPSVRSPAIRAAIACGAAFLSCVCCAAGATVCYVAPGGSDTAPGTRELPFRTIQRAADMLRPGDTCVIRGGTYRETVRPAASGSAGQPVRFAAAPGEEVVISGTEPVAGWSAFRDRIHVTNLSEPVEQVFVNGRMMTCARYPNADTNAWTIHTLVLRPVTNQVLTGDLPERPINYWKGATVWGLSRNLGWVAARFAVTGSVHNLLFYEGKRVPWYGGGAGRAYLSGLLGELDAEREWCQAEGRLYLIPPAGADPDTLAAEVPRRRWGFDLSGRSYIEVTGIRLFAASANLHGATHCVLDGLRVRWPCVQADIRGGFNRDRAVDMNSDGLGIVLSGTNNTIRNSVIAFSTGDGVSVFGVSNAVENCVIHDCDTSASDCAPVVCTGTGHAIRGNTLFNGGRSIVVHRYLKQGRIEHNHLHHAGLLSNDLGMTYTYQTDARGTVMAYNLVHHNLGRAPGNVGIYLDDSSRNHVVHHNVVWMVSEAMAMNPPDSKGNLVLNNTLDGQNVCIGMAWERPQNMAGSRLVNNLFLNRISPRIPPEAIGTNLFFGADPRFVNRAEFDFRLRPDSPAIDAGEAVPPWTDGFAGRAPDLGAFEHGAPAWQAGSTIPEAEWMDDPEWRVLGNHRGPCYAKP
jgi:hypothetical protein